MSAPAQVYPAKDWVTDEDQELERIEFIKSELRSYPLLPPDPNDVTKDFLDVQTGVDLPLAHCAVKGCSWSLDSLSDRRSAESLIAEHVWKQHAAELRLENRNQEEVMAYYCAAIAERERQHMPLIGPSIDRRIFKTLNTVANGQEVYSLICFVCAQVKTHVGGECSHWNIRRQCAGTFLDQAHDIKIQIADGAATTSLELNLGWQYFKRRFASDRNGAFNPFHVAPELADDCWEWSRVYSLKNKNAGTIRLLCCPEDVGSCGKHGEHHICKDCQIPICKSCHSGLLHVASPGIPMALCNDNFWGYTTDVISKYQVRWIESAIVLPCWTSMICYYVEGDYGHLMTEEVGKKRWRTVVKGSCYSFRMPWEDILESLEENISSDMVNIPRDEECVKYMLRLHLKIGGVDVTQHLRQVHVRPFVLLLLLDYLIDQNHEVFHGKGKAQLLKQKMRDKVNFEYPETEGHLPLEERNGALPPSIQKILEEHDEQKKATETSKAGSSASGRLVPKDAGTSMLLTEKNATPSDGSRPLETCLDDIRPKAFTLDRSTTACSDPADMKPGALQQFGELHVHTGRDFINQWHSKYFSQVLPFVIPRMVSGPDYEDNPEKRWRRTQDDAPFVSSTEFTKGFSRRVEAQCRHGCSFL